MCLQPGALSIRAGRGAGRCAGPRLVYSPLTQPTQNPSSLRRVGMIQCSDFWLFLAHVRRGVIGCGGVYKSWIFVRADQSKYLGEWNGSRYHSIATRAGGDFILRFSVAIEALPLGDSLYHPLAELEAEG